MSSIDAVAIPSRRWKRIIPVAFLMYTIAFMDRNNLSMGMIGMEKTLGINATYAGLAGGIFFWGFLFMQIPGALLSQKWSAKKYVAISLLVWSIFAAATGLVQNGTQLLIVRFLLGFTEGGVSTATMMLFTKWFPLSERARANGYWYLAIPVANAVMSPLSGWILSFTTWRWMFIIEALPPLIWTIVWWLFIDDDPSKAGWLSDTERNYVVSKLAEERVVLKKQVPDYKAILKNRNLILLFFIMFFIQIGFGGYSLWLPTLVKSLTGGNIVEVGVLSALPWIAAMFGLVINSRHADRTGEYKWHLATPLFGGAVFLLISVLLGKGHTTLSMISLILCMGIMFGYLGVFWATPSASVTGEQLAVAMGSINAFGNLGGFFGPFIVGYLITSTGNFLDGIIFLVLSLVLAGLMSTFLSAKAKDVRIGESVTSSVTR